MHDNLPPPSMCRAPAPSPRRPSHRAAWACVPSTATSGARGRLARGQGVPAGVKYIFEICLTLTGNVLGRISSNLFDGTL